MYQIASYTTCLGLELHTLPGLIGWRLKDLAVSANICTFSWVTFPQLLAVVATRREELGNE